MDAAVVGTQAQPRLQLAQRPVTERGGVQFADPQRAHVERERQAQIGGRLARRGRCGGGRGNGQQIDAVGRERGQPDLQERTAAGLVVDRCAAPAQVRDDQPLP